MFRSTAKEMLDHFFEDRRLKAALAGPVGDLGLPPSRLAAVMLIGLLTHYSRGAFFPAGGSGPLRDAYVDGLKAHGATLTDANGVFRLEMPQIVPAFGQPHGHLAYDSGEFETVFLRPVMPSSGDTSLEAHFVLQPA